MSKMKKVLCNGVLIAMLIGVAENAAAALEHECVPVDAFSAVFCSIIRDGDKGEAFRSKKVSYCSGPT
ncbi:hypothetical protein [Paraburkholderia unamae]|uniref:Uncharacterized protein n=1 Tax=Paraburkholderia unamae TaxID=219649 RepID=A0ACC6RMG7_9BURK